MELQGDKELKVLIKLIIIALFAVSLSLALVASAQQEEACTVQAGVTVCERDGVICIVNPDGSRICRANPPTPSSPVGQGEPYRVLLPVVER